MRVQLRERRIKINISFVQLETLVCSVASQEDVFITVSSST